MGEGGIKVPINGQDSLKDSREWEKGKRKEQRQMFKVKLFCREEMVQKVEEIKEINMGYMVIQQNGQFPINGPKDFLKTAVF